MLTRHSSAATESYYMLKDVSIYKELARYPINRWRSQLGKHMHIPARYCSKLACEIQDPDTLVNYKDAYRQR